MTINRHLLVKEAWRKLGFKMKPLRNVVVVRTEPINKKVGKDQILWAPPKLQRFYGELANLQLVTATVLAVGSKCKELKPGDHIGFARLFFARLWDINANEQDLVGYVLEENVMGWIDLKKKMSDPDDT